MDKRLELLICGYTHEQEKKTHDALIIPNGITRLIFTFFPKLIRFGKFDRQRFAISEDRTIISGKSLDSCSAFMIYADTSWNNACGKGFSKGVYAWSVQALSPGNEYEGIFSECYESIGVTTKCDVTAASGNWLRDAMGSSYFQGHRGNWKFNETITVILNCDDWNATYFRGTEKIKKDALSPNVSYYLALSCCASESWTKVQVVDTPQELLV